MAKNNAARKAAGEDDAATLNLDTTRIVEGLRDFLLRNVRENGMKKPWNKMTEGEQRLEIERATDRAAGVVSDVVDLIAQGDFPVIHAIVDNFKIKDGEVTITAKGLAEDDVLLTLNHAGKKSVKIVVADAQQFDQSRSNIQPDPDEPGLPGVKVEIQPEEVQEPGETPDEPVVDEDEQAEGQAVLDQLDFTETRPDDFGAVADEPITDMRGFPNGPMQAMKGAARWWSDDGKIWRLATDEDVLPEANNDGEVSDAIELEQEEIEALEEAAHADDGERVDDAVEGDDATGSDPATDVAGDADGSDAAVSENVDGAATAETEPTVDQPALAPAEDAQPEASTGLTNPPDDAPGLTDDQIFDIRGAGIDARKNGFAKSKNPHPAGSEAAQVWAKGYDDEKKREAKDQPKDF